MPLCRHLGDGLWEVRSNLTGGRVARVIFVVHAARMVLLQAEPSDLHRILNVAGRVRRSKLTPRL